MESYCNDMTLLQQGAEARVYTTTLFGRPTIVKERFPKKYRLTAIDEKLTRKRVSQEIRALQRCKKAGIYTPVVYFVDAVRNIIFMEQINGITVREYISATREQVASDSYKNMFPMARIIGQILAKLHDADVIHGDLTTSNMIINHNDNNKRQISCSDIFLIDFGLSSSSAIVEDKGVDLYVLERAFLSTHPGSENLFEELLQSYKESSKKCVAVLSKLDEVRMRGRKRSMVG